jgi:hypothetical protein
LKILENAQASANRANNPQVLQALKDVFNSKVLNDLILGNVPVGAEQSTSVVIKSLQNFLKIYAAEFLKSTNQSLDVFDGLSSTKIEQLNVLDIGPKRLVQEFVNRAISLDDPVMVRSLSSKFAQIAAMGVDSADLAQIANQGLQDLFNSKRLLNRPEEFNSKLPNFVEKFYVPIVDALKQLSTSTTYLGNLEQLAVNMTQSNLNNFFGLVNKLTDLGKIASQERDQLVQKLKDIDRAKTIDDLWQINSVQSFVTSLEGQDLVLDYLVDKDATIKRVQKMIKNDPDTNQTDNILQLQEILKLESALESANDAQSKKIQNLIDQYKGQVVVDDQPGFDQPGGTALERAGSASQAQQAGEQRAAELEAQRNAAEQQAQRDQAQREQAQREQAQREQAQRELLQRQQQRLDVNNPSKRQRIEAFGKHK